jgi:hypothetical protein
MFFSSCFSHLERVIDRTASMVFLSTLLHSFVMFKYTKQIVLMQSDVKIKPDTGNGLQSDM